MQRKTALSLSLSLTLLMGCHKDAPQTPVTEPKASTHPQPTNDNPDPTNKDCAAISDPAQAEDCRLWKGVAEAKKKHNSNNAVKHSPGSIQQP